MTEVIMFCLVTGILSTVALDIWVTLVEKVTGLPPTNWGMVGRWLLGIPQGHWVLSGTDESAPRTGEKALGWAFHYGVGISYSVLLLLIWGVEFVHAPTLMPVLIVGVVISTLAGLMILMPGLGAGFMGRKLPNQGVVFVYVLVAHVVYALALYGAAKAIA
ncbi:MULTISPECIES: DUF2938 family protein [Pseudomonas]|uniref:DUF2938 family protein n=1 Tax=Pseudomonas TaxID=286 RepID=UPI001E483EE3|nr:MULTISPECIES: DUF2938 family protein [Pseudomonas]EKT4502752.1 DUF2938 family protein [Pseudomonas putida]MCK1156641.1 DUF2938 domain-containing protein [Pseudomonas aeruginosa]MDM3893868.1 DUF2938 family protein [Pseudomonas juntendi]